MARLAVLVGLMLMLVDIAVCQRGGPGGPPRGQGGGGRGAGGRGQGPPGRGGGFNDLDERGPRGEGPTNNENNLARDKLFKYPYSKHVRPVASPEETIHLNISYTPIRLVDFDADNMFATMQGWVPQIWTDEFLTWDPTSEEPDYRGVNQLRVSPDDIWRPDIRDYNAVREETGQDEIIMIAYPNGMVVNIPPFMHRIGCHHQDEEDDTHCTLGDVHCKLVLGTWTYNKQEVEMHLGTTWNPTGLTMEHYHEHPTWEMYNQEADLENKVYENWGEVAYPKININFCLRTK